MVKDKIKCIIIDDDLLIIDLLQHFCSKIPFIEYSIGCDNPLEGLNLISEQDFDLLFLDYNMPNLNGKGILDLKQDTSKIIMITSHPEFAVESYNYPDVIDYLLKPLTFDRFYKSLEKFQQSILPVTEKAEKESLFVKDGNKWVQIYFKDLLYIKSESNYVTFYMANQKIMSLTKMKDLENTLPSHLVRVHRSYIVNTAHINFIDNDGLSIHDRPIPVGAKYKKHLQELLGIN